MINRRNFLAPLMALTMVTAPLVMVTTPAVAQSQRGSLTTAITQVIPNVGTFTGTLTTTAFTLANGVISNGGHYHRNTHQPDRVPAWKHYEPAHHDTADGIHWNVHNPYATYRPNRPDTSRVEHYVKSN